MASSDDTPGALSELTLSKLREESERVRALSEAEVLVIVELLKEISQLTKSRRKEENNAEAHAAERKKLEQQIKGLCDELRFWREDEFEELKEKRLGEELKHTQLEEQIKQKRRKAKRKKMNAYRPNPPRP